MVGHSTGCQVPYYRSANNLLSNILISHRPLWYLLEDKTWLELAPEVQWSNKGTSFIRILSTICELVDIVHVQWGAPFCRCWLPSHSAWNLDCEGRNYDLGFFKGNVRSLFLSCVGYSVHYKVEVPIFYSLKIHCHSCQSSWNFFLVRSNKLPLDFEVHLLPYYLHLSFKFRPQSVTESTVQHCQKHSPCLNWQKIWSRMGKAKSWCPETQVLRPQSQPIGTRIITLLIISTMLTTMLIIMVFHSFWLDYTGLRTIFVL